MSFNLQHFYDLSIDWINTDSSKIVKEKKNATSGFTIEVMTVVKSYYLNKGVSVLVNVEASLELLENLQKNSITKFDLSPDLKEYSMLQNLKKKMKKIIVEKTKTIY